MGRKPIRVCHDYRQIPKFNYLNSRTITDKERQLQYSILDLKFEAATQTAYDEDEEKIINRFTFQKTYLKDVFPSPDRWYHDLNKFLPNIEMSRFDIRVKRHL